MEIDKYRKTEVNDKIRSLIGAECLEMSVIAIKIN